MRYRWVYMENFLQTNTMKEPTASLVSLAYTGVFAFAISLLLWFLGVNTTYWDLLGLSLCIGWSIHGTFILLGDKLETLFPPYAAPVICTSVGLSLGLLIAGTFFFHQPLYFFADNHASLVLGVFFGVIGITISRTRNNLVKAKAQLDSAQATQQAQEKMLLETELKLLQAQIEPHFLFNTLSNVVGLVHSDPTAAERTLVNLTTLLRASLQRTREQAVTLGEELDIVQAYLDIQAIRMQGRLSYELRPLSLPLPPRWKIACYVRGRYRLCWYNLWLKMR